jgi:formylglycine-generating enzyme required for sulfatase activity
VAEDAGKFMMGSTETEVNALLVSNHRYKRKWLTYELPSHQIYLDAYSIGKTPVTVQHNMAYCEATGIRKPVAPVWGWREDHPIVNVNA